MKVRAPFHLPEEQQKDLNKLVRLEIINLISRFSIVVVMFFVLGNSQAMKASWYEDILSLLPPIAFLIALHFRARAPNDDFPYGYQGAAVISFLVSAVALTLLGGYLFVDSLIKLISMEHPTIGGINLFGHTIWMGWPMLAALTYGMVIPFVISLYQEPASIRLHEKTVYSDAKMSKANCLTGLAAVIGILGTGAGFWWMDALAGTLIGIDVTLDGARNLREAVGDLTDRRPRMAAKAKPETLPEDLEEMLLAMDWVKRAEVRLREEGHVFSGEAFVVPHSNENLTHNVAEAARQLVQRDWRLYEVVITPLPDEEWRTAT